VRWLPHTPKRGTTDSMGGNIFKTSPIHKDAIPTLMKEFLSEWNRIFPESHPKFSYTGSTGKKEYSGDIDLVLHMIEPEPSQWGISEDEWAGRTIQLRSRARTSTVKMLANKALLQLIGEKLNNQSNLITCAEKKTTTSSLHLLFKNVQIDVNVGDGAWLQFSHYSYAPAPPLKGLHRTQLLVAAFAYCGLSFVHGHGIRQNNAPNNFVAYHPIQAMRNLSQKLGIKISVNDCISLESLVHCLRSQLSPTVFGEIYRMYYDILDRLHEHQPDLKGMK